MRQTSVRVQEQKCRNFPKMIVQIVLVIVTTVQVNSHQLCPSVCQCYGDQATCTTHVSPVDPLNSLKPETKTQLCLTENTPSALYRGFWRISFKEVMFVYCDIQQTRDYTV
jgi:hypothetical protein